jgi:ElaB/YqjD/DUF883 family membrane-anchored ribosome-binding protein
MANEHRTTPQTQPWNPGAGRTGNQGKSGSGGATGLMEKAQDAASGVAEWASGAADTAREWASDVAQGAEQAYTATRDTVVGAEESFEAFIRRRPIESVLIAFGVGCLAGCALSRR